MVLTYSELVFNIVVASLLAMRTASHRSSLRRKYLHKKDLIKLNDASSHYWRRGMRVVPGSQGRHCEANIVVRRGAPCAAAARWICAKTELREGCENGVVRILWDALSECRIVVYTHIS